MEYENIHTSILPIYQTRTASTFVMDFVLRVLKLNKINKNPIKPISLILIEILFAIRLPCSVISLSSLSKNFHLKSKLSW